MKNRKFLACILMICMLCSFISITQVSAAVYVPDSTFFSTAYEEDSVTYETPSDGDLWPGAWSDDDYLYVANGDGKGFSNGAGGDICISKVSGTPAARNMTGTTIARSTQISQVWDRSGNYNMKPTGMLSVGGVLYCAVQDLSLDFQDAPNATICKSTDHGVTWTHDTTGPMFNNHIFTTIMFLDFGKDNANAIDNYVYAYALDYNWRATDKYPSPDSVYLARVPKTSIMNRSTWEFYTGMSGSTPTWSSNINDKKPTLQDNTLRYGGTLITQGGVVYDAPLKKYIYSCWSGVTHEFYESSTPWGPWNRFLSKDFGDYNSWNPSRAGGYGTVIHSKFISADGKTMYVQSNCFGIPTGYIDYNMSYRKLVIEPFAASTASNTKNGNNLALPQYANGVTRINKSFHVGDTGIMNDGNLTGNQDSWDTEAKTTDWWGYTWPQAKNLNRLVYTTGSMFSDGGWFNNIQVQVRQNFQWINVTNLNLDGYPCSNTAGNNVSYTFTFNDTWGDGVRIVGAPGGTAHFTSISELGAYYTDNTNLVQDSSFENQTSGTISSPWTIDGTDAKGIDRRISGYAHSGANNAWLNNTSTNWDAVKQSITVTPNTNYKMTVWLTGSSNIGSGFIGIADTNSVTFANRQFGSLPGYTKLTVYFNSGSNTTVIPYAGYFGPGAASWLRIDDMSVVKDVDTGNLIQDPGFEKQTTNTISAPYITDGAEGKGIDRGIGFAHSGANNAWINQSTTNWNAVKQTITVQPNKTYRMTVWLQGSSNISAGFIGIADAGNVTFANQQFGSLPNYTMLTLDFNSGNNTTITPYAGFWGVGSAAWLRIDDMSVVGINWN